MTLLDPTQRDVIVIDVYGTPQPQGSKTAVTIGGKARVIEGRRGPARENFKSWRQAVATAASDWVREHDAPPALDVPVRVSLTFFMPRPKSAPKRVLYPGSRPDIDKLARAVLDAITGVLITDDSRVCALDARKEFALDRPAGCSISVEVLQ